MTCSAKTEGGAFRNMRRALYSTTVRSAISIDLFAVFGIAHFFGIPANGESLYYDRKNHDDVSDH